MKYLIILFFSLFLYSCNNKENIEARKYSIEITNKYVESLERENDSLKSELIKCPDWVSVLENK